MMLAGGLLGLKDVAGLRAMQTLVAPIAVMLNAFGTLSLPWLVRQCAERGLNRWETSVSTLTWFFSVLASLGVALLLMFGGTLTDLLYKGKYAEYVWLLPYLGLAQVVASGAIGLGLGLRSFEASRRLLVASMLAAASVAAVGYLAIRLGGLQGVGVGTVITQLVLAGALFVQLRHERRDRAAGDPRLDARWNPLDVRG
jgi:O-antigen/teichoic acid export membrane protein